MASKNITFASPEPVSFHEPAGQALSGGSDAGVASSTVSKKEPITTKTELEGSKTGESAKTARESLQEPSKLLTSDAEDGPPRPKRSVSPMSQVKKNLQDAFPQTDEKYVYACLIASGGNAEPAFRALLYLLDPSYQPEIVPAPAPASQPPAAALTDDEVLARQLQKEFDKEERKRRIRATQRQRQHLRSNDGLDDESPDEFEQLKESFAHGFEEAKLTLNNWVSEFSKNFSKDDKSENSPQSPKLFGALGGSSFNRNSNAHNRGFNEDPEILSLDFQRNLDMSDLRPPVPKRAPAAKDDPKWQPLN